MSGRRAAASGIASRSLSESLREVNPIIIAGRRDSPHTRAILREVHRRFIPNKIVILVDGGNAQQRLAESLEILDSIVEIGGKSTAYICEDYVCKLPTNEVAAVARLLDE